MTTDFGSGPCIVMIFEMLPAALEFLRLPLPILVQSD